MTGCLVAISTSLFISVNLGSLATQTTTYVLLGISILMKAKELWSLFTASRAGHFEDACTEFESLILNRAMELVLPVSYLACFLAAFHGPNSGVLGNVGNSYWHYKAVEDIWEASYGIVLFVFVDFVAMIVSAIFSYCLAGFNALTMLGYLQKEYGNMIAISQGYLIIHNFCVIIVACALDLTFRFNWVLKDGSGEI